ncbi:hypothetical protein IQ273_05805 [Nodosilinea sp. LEGE 07298]|uniref:hypothetical protein n=1 Tax=Nodosilinea sp. LEGE 07298 TaxID=2777970 RepID=UPI00187E78D4|nr:hypothetical protein [Nodosilinea sp. LEGE 07298]MBE9108931.1 hypothetical protein [Nodosilinea sp. LEGE 07298]
MGKSRLSPRQRSYEADLINRLSDNQRLNQAQQRISNLTPRDRDLVTEHLSGRTRDRLRQNY